MTQTSELRNGAYLLTRHCDRAGCRRQTRTDSARWDSWSFEMMTDEETRDYCSDAHAAHDIAENAHLFTDPAQLVCMYTSRRIAY